MKTLRGLLVVALLAGVSCFCVTTLYTMHGQRRGEALSYLANLPEPLARAMTLEFGGVAADHLVLKALTYLGQKLIGNESTSPEEYQAIYRALKQATNLDPRFFDPYVLAQMTLPYDAGMVRETNELLERAAAVRTDDYRPHFFLWHNYFTYLNDPKTAGLHLEKAARIPGAPTYFATLAARTNLYAGKIHAAVIFLEETLKETNDPSLRKFLGIRLEALKRIGFLEFKIGKFREQFKRAPKHLQELIDSGLITKIPRDPYGGEFFIMEGGRVYTTSKLVPPQKNI